MPTPTMKSMTQIVTYLSLANPPFRDTEHCTQFTLQSKNHAGFVDGDGVDLVIIGGDFQVSLPLTSLRCTSANVARPYEMHTISTLPPCL